VLPAAINHSRFAFKIRASHRRKIIMTRKSCHAKADDVIARDVKWLLYSPESVTDLVLVVTEVPERRTIRCRHLDSIIDTEGSALKHLQFPKKSQPVFGQVQSGLEQSSNDVLLQGRLQRPSMWYYMLYDRRNPMDASKWRAFWDTTVFLLRVKQDLL